MARQIVSVLLAFTLVPIHGFASEPDDPEDELDRMERTSSQVALGLTKMTFFLSGGAAGLLVAAGIVQLGVREPAQVFVGLAIVYGAMAGLTGWPRAIFFPFRFVSKAGELRSRVRASWPVILRFGQRSGRPRRGRR